jgi:hypothetical protein
MDKTPERGPDRRRGVVVARGRWQRAAEPPRYDAGLGSVMVSVSFRFPRAASRPDLEWSAGVRDGARVPPGLAPSSRPQETILPGCMRISGSESVIASALPRISIPARAPGVGAREVVDHDRGAAAASDVAELLRAIELVAAHIDRILLGVVPPHADGNDVRRPILSDRGDPRQPPLAQVRELTIGEDAHFSMVSKSPRRLLSRESKLRPQSPAPPRAWPRSPAHTRAREAPTPRRAKDERGLAPDASRARPDARA